MQSRILRLKSVDSTNTYLKRLAAEGAAEGTAVIAEQQSAGRGRMGRSFVSPEGEGAYMSWLIRPSCEPSEAASITAHAAAAVCMALERTAGVSPELKWINDLYLGGKKICGILCESSVGADAIEFIVIGIGLNVNTPSFPEELSDKAGSLFTQTGRRFARAELEQAIIKELERMYALWSEDKRAYLEEYRSRCAMLGKSITVKAAEGEYSALALGIDEDFGLRIKRGDELLTLRSGEVSVRL